MRRALLIALCFLLGAMLNIAIAMACARWSDHWPDRFGGSVPVQVVPSDANDYLSDPNYMRGFGSDRATGLSISKSWSFGCTRRSFERWYDREHLGYTRSHEYLQFGVPFRAMEYVEQSWFDFASYPEFSSWRVQGPAGGWPFALAPNQQGLFGPYVPPQHIYPLTIIPWGFAANSILYGLLVYGVLFFFGISRRKIRMRRGLCPKCAYPIGVSPVCTECGTLFRKSA